MDHLNQQLRSCFQATLNILLLNSRLLQRCSIIKRLLHTKTYSYRT
nr:MAG TPA_asm: hypothetical protein [Bacteriophage sp.]